MEIRFEHLYTLYPQVASALTSELAGEVERYDTGTYVFFLESSMNRYDQETVYQAASFLHAGFVLTEVSASERAALLRLRKNQTLSLEVYNVRGDDAVIVLPSEAFYTETLRALLKGESAYGGGA
jgi:hypothetical protein